jgi:hypothetical protein
MKRAQSSQMSVSLNESETLETSRRMVKLNLMEVFLFVFFNLKHHPFNLCLSISGVHKVQA